DIMLTGKNIYPRQAKKIGLVDLVTSRPSLLDSAISFALELAAGKFSRKIRKTFLERTLEGNFLTRRIIFYKAREMVMKRTYGNYPAPLKIIECVESGIEKGIAAGFEAEEKKFGELVAGAQSRQLINLFFNMNASGKNPLKSEARKIRKIAILGAGFMGAGIAQVTAARGIDVALKEISEDALAAGMKGIWDDLSKRVRKGALLPQARDATMSRVRGALDYGSLRNSDIVVEAVFEDIELKKKVLEETEEEIKGEFVFASNTSALPISLIADASRQPANVIGMHYFSPVPKMPLLEIIVTEKTAKWVEATAIELGVIQGKNVIVVRDGPGFYTTRILAPFLEEALALLLEGACVELIDQAMMKAGFPVGPLKLLDEVGIDVGAHVSRGVIPQLFAARGLQPTGALVRLFEAGYRGRKNSRGFYRYGKGAKKKREVNREIYKFFGGCDRKRF
ncbi:MAG: fatty acid oxidation complex subunit alpha FadJ, partial [Deltaproteobacteria bacterium]|nr:fatty acid oxidation complex subunit alpha FadJ [Deltaproteobacteria bacterium]